MLISCRKNGETTVGTVPRLAEECSFSGRLPVKNGNTVRWLCKYILKNDSNTLSAAMLAGHNTVADKVPKGEISCNTGRAIMAN